MADLRPAQHLAEAFRQATKAMATALPNSHKLIVDGDHLIDPAAPAVLAFLEQLR